MIITSQLFKLPGFSKLVYYFEILKSFWWKIELNLMKFIDSQYETLHLLKIKVLNTVEDLYNANLETWSFALHRILHYIEYFMH